MDYKEQIAQAKSAASKWLKQHPIVGVGELRVDLMTDDLTRSISELLSRAEAAEAERDAAIRDICRILKSLPYGDFCSLCKKAWDDCDEGETGICEPEWVGPREELKK